MPRRPRAATRRGLRPRTRAVFAPGRKALAAVLTAGLCMGLATDALARDLVVTGGERSLTVTVADAEMMFVNGRPAVQYSLTEAGDAAVRELTAGIVGQEMTVSLCGRVMLRATVQGELAGVGQLTLNHPTAAAVVEDVLSGRSDCAALDARFDD